MITNKNFLTERRLLYPTAGTDIGCVLISGPPQRVERRLKIRETKYLTMLSILLLSGCSLFKNNQPTLQEISNFCAAGYVDRARLGDKDSYKDIKCNSEMFVSFRNPQPYGN